MAPYRQTAASSLPIAKDSYLYSIISTAAKVSASLDDYEPLSSADRLVTISSDNQLLILSPETLKVESQIKNISTSVTSLKPFAGLGKKCDLVLTAGRDGIVAGWDLRSQTQAIKFEVPKGSRDPLSAIACNAESFSIAAGTELEGNGPGDVSIFLWDTRKPNAARMSYTESHTDTITELKFLPYPDSAPTVLLSGSTDGLVNVFDTTQTEEDDAVVQVINHHSAIHHTGLIGQDIYALGTDEKLSFHVQQNPQQDYKEPDPFKLGDIRELLSCDYTIGVRNHAQPLLAVGKYSEPQQFKLVPLRRAPLEESKSPKWILDIDNSTQLDGGHGEEVIREFYIDSASRTVFTCGEDSKVIQWRGPEAIDVDMSEPTSPVSKRKHGNRKGGIEKRKKK